jgi:hypothetical protein
MSDDAKTFSQDEVNRIVGERVAAIKSAKDAEIAALRDEVKGYSAKASQFDALSAEAAALRSELAGVRTSAERAEVFAGAGVADASTRKRLEVLYSAETAGVEDAPAFGDWIGAAKADPAFSAWFGASATAAASSVAAPPAPARAVPQTSANATEPPTGRRLAPADVLREHSALLSAGKVKEAGEFLRQHASA